MTELEKIQKEMQESVSKKFTKNDYHKNNLGKNKSMGRKKRKNIK